MSGGGPFDYIVSQSPDNSNQTLGLLDLGFVNSIQGLIIINQTPAL